MKAFQLVARAHAALFSKYFFIVFFLQVSGSAAAAMYRLLVGMLIQPLLLSPPHIIIIISMFSILFRVLSMIYFCEKIYSFDSYDSPLSLYTEQHPLNNHLINIK